MGACRPVGYSPRPTATSDLRRIVAEHLPAFVERTEHDGAGLPGFVTAELEGLVRCGDFEHGFLRLLCTRCGDELRVPFSCKGRGTCPSCIGRRMGEGASNWLDHLLPKVPYRQWVLSFDSSVAVRLGYDARALGVVCRSFARRVMQRLRARCKQQHALRSVGRLHPGMLVVVQRFRSDCGLFVHIHSLVTDGAFEQQADGSVVFRSVTGLCELDLVRVLDEVAADLAQAGVLDDELVLDATLAACVQLSLSTPPPLPAVASEPSLVAFAHGMSLHAATTVDRRDRKRLERVCKYLLRPPFAHDAVHLLPDGRVRLDLPRKGRFITMTPAQFLSKLAALVPPPHQNLVRYAGVFANRHHLRPRIVPAPELTVRPPTQLRLFDFAGEPLLPTRSTPEPKLDALRMYRRSWACLLARVFAIDVTTCPCGGRLKIVEVVVDPDAIALHLHGARAPPRPPPHGQLSLLPP
jgi:hypothetical protein